MLEEALQLSKTAEQYPHDILQEAALSNIGRGFSKINKQRKALALFAQVIERISKQESFGDSIIRLAMVGFDFENAGLKADRQIQNILHKISESWVEDEPFIGCNACNS